MRPGSTSTRPLARRVAAVPPPDAGPSSCSDAAARPRHGGLLRRAAARPVRTPGAPRRARRRPGRRGLARRGCRGSSRNARSSGRFELRRAVSRTQRLARGLAATLPDGSRRRRSRSPSRSRESEHEADALELWDGHGAVQLLAYDRERHALLLERCEPGTSLLEPSRTSGEAHAVAVARALGGSASRPPANRSAPSRTTAARWGEKLPRRWEELGQAVRARDFSTLPVAALRRAAATQGVARRPPPGLRTRGNVLAREREPWLVIDPKPRGRRARARARFALLRDRRWRRIERRLDFRRRRTLDARPRAHARLGDRAHARVGLHRARPRV